MDITTETATFGSLFYAVLSNTVASQPTDRVSIAYVTHIVHDPTCQAPAMMHGMVDLGCMLHITSPVVVTR